MLLSKGSLSLAFHLGDRGRVHQRERSADGTQHPSTRTSFWAAGGQLRLCVTGLDLHCNSHGSLHIKNFSLNSPCFLIKAHCWLKQKWKPSPQAGHSESFLVWFITPNSKKFKLISQFSKRIAGSYWPLQATKWVKKKLPALCMATKNQIPLLLLSPLSQAALCVMDFLTEFMLRNYHYVWGEYLPKILWCSKEWGFLGCLGRVWGFWAGSSKAQSIFLRKRPGNIQAPDNFLSSLHFWMPGAAAVVAVFGKSEPRWGSAAWSCAGGQAELRLLLPLGVLVILQALCKYF